MPLSDRHLYFQQEGHYTIFGNPIRININRKWQSREVGHGWVKITKWAYEYQISFDKSSIEPGFYMYGK